MEPANWESLAREQKTTETIICFQVTGRDAVANPCEALVHIHWVDLRKLWRNIIPHACVQRFHTLRTGTHSCLISALRRFVDRRLIGHSCSHRAIQQPPGAPSTVCNGTRSSQIRTQGTSQTSLWVNRCATPLCNKLHIMLNVQIYLRKCITRASVVSLAPSPEPHAPQVMGRTSFKMRVEQMCRGRRR